eukprot:TRINITY_DN7769_c0_g2_i9.p1 TRINITY_DN7769_c0_g2~~TRINITY_DN7769_c0_g2_i9.p1  ORF type:complete len:234 (-),score=49.63 TRINITY_DN7769_c0_g2_i9:333-1034(-)
MQKDSQAKRVLSTPHTLDYTLKTVAQLDWYQLAESVIAITGKRRANEGPSKNKEDFEYLVEFDKTTGLKPLWLDYESLERLSRMREELLPQFSPDWGSVKVTRSQPLRGIISSRSSARSRKSKSIAKSKSRAMPMVEKENIRTPSKSQKSISKLNLKPVKQMWNLLDESTMGRRINFDTHNLCHHCKRILPMTHLSLCRYSSQKNGLIVPNCLTINNTSLYNSRIPITLSCCE